MKKLTAIIYTFFCMQNSFSQANLISTQQLSITQMVDTLISPLDKTGITSGILYDRVFPFAGLHGFNILHGNPDTSSYAHFYQAYSEIYNAAYDKTNFMNYYRLDTIAKAIYYTTNIIPIAVMYYNFNIMDTNAIAHNLIYRGSDSLLHDVQGRSTDPFKTKNVTVAAALATDTIAYGNGNFQFKYYSNLFLTNKHVTITSITADFGSGIQDITSGNIVTINYGAGGTKTIKFIINYSNGQLVTTYSKVFIKITIVSPGQQFGIPIPPDEIDSIFDTQYGFQGYDETSKVYNKGTYGIYYHRLYPGGPKDTKIKKPILIIDGFDPLDQRKESNIYGQYLQYTQTNNFGDEMVNQGYDVIILNFPNLPIGTVTVNLFGITFYFPIYRHEGADYIERNAFLLITLIEKINSQLIANGSSEKLVVIGPSMGGLISRYALKWMEDHGHNHNTKLWISFDAPHKGANIPIGDQHFLDFFANKAGNLGAEQARDLQINSVAAKQMLLHHYLGNYGVLNSLPVGAPGFRDRWQHEIDSLGYPSNLRKISLINGAINGTLQGTACQNVLLMQATFQLRLLIFKVNLINVAAATVSFAGNYANFCEVFNGWAKIWFNTNGRSAAAPPSSKSYDIVPGGYYNAQEAIVESGVGYNPLLGGNSFGVGVETKFIVPDPTHSFIPTFSSLGIDLTNKDLSANLYNRNLICSGESPFDTYYGPQTNEEHITLTTSNVSWLKNEINGQPQPPTYNYTGTYVIQLVSGSEPLCSGSNAYSVSNIPSGGNATWSTIPTGAANISYSGNGAQVTVSNPIAGDFTLVATLNFCNKSAMAAASRSVHSGGYGSGDYPITGPSGACRNQGVSYSTNVLPGATNYAWFWPSGWTYNGGQGTPYLSLITGSTTGNFQIGVRVANACDAGGSPAIENTFVNNCGNKVDSLVTVSPNPSTGGVTISVSNNQISKTINNQNKIYKIRVANQYGNIQKQYGYSSGITTTHLNLTGFINGVYIIQIFTGTEWTYKKLIISH
ncbi:MAG: T9SS type A sorting domain-containing protein [Chitinophagaceae bacterium]